MLRYFSFAPFKQCFQDWCTQQWIILWGKKISHDQHPWLFGPMYPLNKKGVFDFEWIARQEGLEIKRNCSKVGLIPCFDDLNLSKIELERLSPAIIDFYEHSSDYELSIQTQWNVPFNFFGSLLNKLFSRRIHQLYIPNSNNDWHPIRSEFIQIIHPQSKEIKYTIWLRTIASTGQVVLVGFYELSALPSGKMAIKATFPLPNGNTTSFFIPNVGEDGSLILKSKGTQLGASGFYFVTKDTQGQYWSRYHSLLTDELKIKEEYGLLKAEQVFKLWKWKVLTLNYDLQKK